MVVSDFLQSVSEHAQNIKDRILYLEVTKFSTTAQYFTGINCYTLKDRNPTHCWILFCLTRLFRQRALTKPRGMIHQCHVDTTFHCLICFFSLQRFAGETLKSRLRSIVILDSSGKQDNFTNFLSQGLIVLLFLAHVCIKPFQFLGR